MTSVRLVSVAVGNRELVRTVSARDQPFVLFPSIGEYAVYDGRAYDAFDMPDQRLRAYREAISAAVPGKVALDIGTGRDALWAVHAARAGAQHVFAVEQLPEAADQARRAVAKAGLTDRVTVIQGRSTDVELPESAQVCISEIVGNIASAEGVRSTSPCRWTASRSSKASTSTSPSIAPPATTTCTPTTN